MIRTVAVILILFFFFHVCSYSQESDVREKDSISLSVKQIKKISGTWLMEVGYFKKGKLIYRNPYMLPAIYLYAKDGFVSIRDTGYFFITNSYISAKSDYAKIKPVDYYTEFPELMNDNKKKIDSVFIKGAKRKMRRNFKSKNVSFVYLKFSATITYFEDHAYWLSLPSDYYYYDFDDKDDQLLVTGKYPWRYILSIKID